MPCLLLIGSTLKNSHQKPLDAAVMATSPSRKGGLSPYRGPSFVMRGQTPGCALPLTPRKPRRDRNRQPGQRRADKKHRQWFAFDPEAKTRLPQARTCTA